ncbi:hypothetical protein ACWEO2_17470 [Nocardia sp. NPDC004278]
MLSAVTTGQRNTLVRDATFRRCRVGKIQRGLSISEDLELSNQGSQFGWPATWFVSGMA